MEGLDRHITGNFGEDSVGEDLTVKQAQEILDAAGSGWIALHDAALETCCGKLIEWDEDRCPSCFRPNPLLDSGI